MINDAAAGPARPAPAIPAPGAPLAAGPTTWPARPAPRRYEDPAVLAARAGADPARPRWHVTAPYGWLNDPNGLSLWPGPDGSPRLHLFYQANPAAPVHDRIHWGHQVSEDLVTWRDLPIALSPDEIGPDSHGCWSGVIVNDNGAPTAVYSGNAAQPTQVCRLARGDASDPDLVSWNKEPGALIAGPPPGLDVLEMRDHSVWHEDGRWWQIMGSGLPGLGGAALAYSSTDLLHWRWEGVLAVGDGECDGVRATATVWECPELITLESADGSPVDVLLVCPWDAGRTLRSVWMTGARHGARMEIGLVGSQDLGENYFYAPQSTLLPDGRRIMIGWMQSALDKERAMAAGWSGSMSIPREVGLAEDGTLRYRPIAELERLRGRQVAHAEDERATGLVARGRSLDIGLSGRLGDAPLVIDALASDDGERRTRITVRRRPARGIAPGAVGQEAWAGWLEVDRSASAVPGSPIILTDTRLLAGEVPLGGDGAIDMRILIDRSSLEVFVNGQPLSARVGSDPGDDAVVIRSGLEGARIEAWEVGPAYGDRLVPMA
ncbi:fructan beta-fructosidase [Actinomyces sp. Chiba101]|uniref:glycoside hydrolase family 32 protein n=1 Tax=Actinomyces TaxID=1654 RepID=UPI000974F537|nr:MULTISPECIES: glycoside hydrolase family 32 protein [Actinomyces]BAW93938.1 fructan beta-fructosidase [Actinomyces sp. Chiba101]GAV93358.1 fructan beta-fructosidase [Actinomyces denticolens]SUU74439.1 Sucrose-6-phosphate hydrolase [Actinomyces denticolens]